MGGKMGPTLQACQFCPHIFEGADQGFRFTTSNMHALPFVFAGIKNIFFNFYTLRVQDP